MRKSVILAQESSLILLPMHMAFEALLNILCLMKSRQFLSLRKFHDVLPGHDLVSAGKGVLKALERK